MRVKDLSSTFTVLVALYRTPEESRKAGVVHKTPPQLMRGLLAIWMRNQWLFVVFVFSTYRRRRFDERLTANTPCVRWFPHRKTVFAGDGGFASHELAAFASRHSHRLALVSKFPPDAVLHDPPPPRKPGQTGRPRVVGTRLPSPRDVVASRPRGKRLTVKWYGGGTRRIEVITGTGHWYRQGQGLVPLRWIHVRDLTGSHRDEYFFSTAARLSVKRIVEAFVGRWDIEVTFEEMREHLGLETTRGRCRNTVLRAEPCLFCLYALIVSWFDHLPRRSRQTIHVNWTGKTRISFSDARTSVRRNAWNDYRFPHPTKNAPVEKLTARRKQTILDALALPA